jgi:hypothetical protein
MAVTLKEILVRLGADTKEVDQALSNTGKKSKDLGDAFASMKRKIDTVIGTAVIVKFLKGSAMEAINAEETFSKFGVVFKDSIGTANSALEDLKTNYGLSGVAAADMLGQTGDLLSGLGATSDVALDLSTKTQKLAVDLASFTNYAGGASGASVALTKAMLGQREMLQGMGIAIYEEAVQERLATLGKEKLTGASLLAAKAEVVLQLAMEQSGNAINDYARTSDSAANQIRLLQNSFQDFQVELGKSIIQTEGFKTAFTAINDILKDPAFINALSEIAAAIADVLSTVIPTIAKIIVELVKLKDVLIPVGIAIASAFAVNKIASWGGAISSVIPKLKAFITAGGGIGLVLGAIAGIGYAVNEMFNEMADIEDRQMATIQEHAAQFDTLNDALKRVRDEAGLTSEFMRELSKELAGIEDPARKAQAKLNAIKFEELAKHAKLTDEELRKIIDDFSNIEDPARRYQKILIAISQGKYDNDARKLSVELKEVTKNYVISKDAVEGVKKKTGELTKEQKKQVELSKEQKKEAEKLKKAFDDLSSSLGILAGQKLKDVNQEAANLKTLFDANKTAFSNNSEQAKKFDEKLQEIIYSFGGLNKAPKIIQDLNKEFRELNKATLEIDRKKLADPLGLDNIIPKLDDFISSTNASVETMEALNYNMDVFRGMTPGSIQIITEWTQKAVDASNETEEVAKETENLSQIFTSLVTTTQGAFEAIEQLGLDLGELPAILQTVTSGISSFGAGLNSILNAKKGIVGVLSSINVGFSMLTEAISVVSEVLKALSGPSGELEAARRRMQGLQMNTEGWGEKIEELAKQLGGADSAGRAFNALLADMIRDSNITVSNFDNYIAKVREIVSTYEQGNATIEETQRNFGAAFDAIIEAASGLGLEGAQSLRALIELADEFGLSVQEINSYIDESKDTALVGWMESIKTFGDFSIPIFDDMLAIQEKLADNQQLIDSIEGANQAMMNLAKTPDFNASQFDVFQKIAVDAMEKLKTANFDVAQAMDEDAGLRGMLQNIIFLSEQYGFTVDDATQALIDQGIASGALTKKQKSESDIMIDGFDRIAKGIERLVGLMGGDMPDAVENMARRSVDSIDSISRATSQWGDSLGNVYDDINNVTGGIRNMGSVHDDVMRGGSIIPDLKDWEKENWNIERQIKDDMISSILSMGGTFGSSMSSMMSSSWHLYDQMSTNADELRLMYEALGETAFAAGVGTSKYERYGVGVEERDTEKFTELHAVWERNWEDITKSEEGLENFIKDLEGLDVIDQLENDLSEFIKWVTFTGERIGEGLIWDPETLKFVSPDELKTGSGIALGMQEYLDRINEMNATITTQGGIKVPGISAVNIPGNNISGQSIGGGNAGPTNISREINNYFQMDATVNQDLYTLALNIKKVIENDTEGVRTLMEAL